MKVFFIRFKFSLSSRLDKFYRPPKPRKQLKIPDKFYPKQHPKRLTSPSTPLISLDKKPTKALTPYQEIPESLYQSNKFKDFKQPKEPKTLYLGLFGATNVGKSSLLNKLLGENLSAISSKSHTTDEKLTGIYTDVEKSTQIIMYDTPGIYHKNGKHDRKYSNKAWKVMEEIDHALFVVDGAKKKLDDGIKEVIRKLNTKTTDIKSFRLAKDLDSDLSEFEKATPQKIFKVLVVNKIDLCSNKRDLKWYINELEDLGNFDKIFYTSCETGYGIEALREFLLKEAKKDQWFYNPEAKSEMTDLERIEEIFKSLIFERMHYELPFRIGIELKEFVVMSDNTAKIEVHFDVETQIQMKILIGYHGRNIKYITQKARVELIKLYKKDFKITAIVKKRTHKLEEYRNFPEIEQIVPKKFPIKHAKQKLKQLKLESKEKFIAKERNDGLIDSDLQSSSLDK